MGRLDRLAKKSEMFKIEGEIPEDSFEIKIQPMVFKDLVKFTEYEENGKKDESLNFLVYITLRRAFTEEEYTDEQLREKVTELPFDFVVQLIEVINRVNGLNKKTEFNTEKQ